MVPGFAVIGNNNVFFGSERSCVTQGVGGNGERTNCWTMTPETSTCVGRLRLEKLLPLNMFRPELLSQILVLQICINIVEKALIVGHHLQRILIGILMDIAKQSTY